MPVARQSDAASPGDCWPGPLVAPRPGARSGWQCWAGGLLLALARACTPPVISVATGSVSRGAPGAALTAQDWASVTVGSVGLSRRCPSCPFSHSCCCSAIPSCALVITFVGRAFSCSLLAPRAGAAVPARCRLRAAAKRAALDSRSCCSSTPCAASCWRSCSSSSAHVCSVAVARDAPARAHASERAVLCGSCV